MLAPEDPDVGFDCEEDSLFAEILFLEEDAANDAMPKVVAALEAEGFRAEVAEFDQEEEDVSGDPGVHSPGGQ